MTQKDICNRKHDGLSSDTVWNVISELQDNCKYLNEYFMPNVRQKNSKISTYNLKEVVVIKSQTYTKKNVETESAIYCW